MDLNRLKIDKPQEAPRGRAWKTILACVVCLAIGFSFSRVVAFTRSKNAVRVKTSVAQSAAGPAGKRFTSGGWIEAATPAYPIVVSAPISERLWEVCVKQGDRVEPGQVIAKLFDQDAKSRVDLRKAQYEVAKAKADLMRAGYRREEIDAAQAKAEEAAQKADIAKLNYERSRNLGPGTVSKELVDNRLSAYKEAQATHSASLAELEKMRAGYRKEDIAMAEANLREATAQVDLAERELSYCSITAPASGPPLRVLNIMHKVGEWIDATKEANLISLYDPNDLHVRVDVTQSNIKGVTLGGKAVVTTEADATRQYSGVVARIDPLAELAKNTITVRVRIENPDTLLFPEMTAQVAFQVEEEKGGDSKAVLVPSEAVVTDGDKTYVFVVVDGHAWRREVAVAGDQGTQKAISDGLYSGQRVVVNGLDSLKDGQGIEEE